MKNIGILIKNVPTQNLGEIMQGLQNLHITKVVQLDLKTTTTPGSWITECSSFNLQSDLPKELKDSDVFCIYLKYAETFPKWRDVHIEGQYFLEYPEDTAIIDFNFSKNPNEVNELIKKNLES